MEPESDRRFDPNHAAQLLLEVANEQSLESLLRKLVTIAAEHPAIGCAQVWLVQNGDLCSTCPSRVECPDRSRCLHLAAEQYAPLADGTWLRTVLPERRAPLGVGLLGEVAATKEERLFRDLRRERVTALGAEWLARQRIRGCAAAPVVFKGEVLGVVAGFTYNDFPEEFRLWSRVFADHLGAAISNARAFEEIRQLKAQLELQNAYLREEVQEAGAYGDLVGQSAALGQIVNQIELVAPTDASVLILGETGTGKELVAREIHRRSSRKEGPLVRVNCASIPKDLFESEFFGHAKGAFSGAVRDRSGRFETARGGTIFLDEVGEIPVEIQGKLLRVLQEKQYEKVGEDRTRIADVRVISATNRDLKQAVAEGRFREDLYYRLHVFPIAVPPLRERRDDIPLLAARFVELSIKELRCPPPRLTRAGLAALQSYDWPGNIRELRNVIERAVILARGGALCFDLPAIRGEASPAAVFPGEENPGFLTEAELRARERENLALLLSKTGWKIKGSDGAAELLGVKPTTLLSRIKRMGLKRPRA